VKTLSRATFKHVDELTAPRLVEYWEQDPCYEPPSYGGGGCGCGGMAKMAEPMSAASPARDYGVRVEAQFEVGEYEIVVLSAQDSTGLDAWLRDNKYKIPEGAEPHLKPYVQGGYKFFVARVNVNKVAFVDGRASLSPLRFHYDTDKFELPVRLGLINSAGTQDLIVVTLAHERYEVANFPNASIPTNLEVADEAREKFGPMYAALFDRTLEKHPGAVVTEYSWDASSCDPCPTPPLNESEIAVLGGDVIDPSMDAERAAAEEGDAGGDLDRMRARAAQRRNYRRGDWTVTRMHARYSKESLGQDLVFRTAQPIEGGREIDGDKSPRGARPSSTNNFQGRYVIRHPWTGAVECSNPIYGRWGGPPDGEHLSSRPGQTKPATNLAFVARGTVQLPAILRDDVPELDVKAGAAPVAKSTPRARSGACAGCIVGSQGSDLAIFGLGAIAIGGLIVRRVRRRRVKE
jgi:hypothetical protein